MDHQYNYGNVGDSRAFVARIRNRSSIQKKARKEQKKLREANVKKLLTASMLVKNAPVIKKKESEDCPLTPAQKKYYIDLLKQRKQQVLNNQVKISLLETGFNLGNDFSNKSITIDDVRSFILFLQLQHHMMGGIPSWVKIVNSKNLIFSAVLVVEDVGLNDMEAAEDIPTLKSAQYHIPMYSPCSYGGDIVSDLVTAPLSLTQLKLLEGKYARFQEADKSKKESQELICTMFRVEKDLSVIKPVLETESVSHWKHDKFPRTRLLLTPWQMIQSNYPLPIDDNPYNDFVNLKEKYKPATDQSPMYGLDCEMCQTTQGSELTRVSVVNENHEIVYERLVKPYNPIVNYLTRFSGITRKMLEPVDTRLEQVQAELSQLLPPDAILIGQSLNSDLLALKLMHPYVIDTSVIFNMSGDWNRKTGLRILTQEFLSERIQQGGSLGHDSIEDALAALKLVQAKLQKCQ